MNRETDRERQRKTFGEKSEDMEIEYTMLWMTGYCVDRDSIKIRS